MGRQKSHPRNHSLSQNLKRQVWEHKFLSVHKILLKTRYQTRIHFLQIPIRLIQKPIHLKINIKILSGSVMKLQSNPKFLSLLILGLAMLISSALIVRAVSKDDILYPVKELDNCKNEAACRTYCDAGNNLDRAKTCINFAKKHNLLAPEELEEAERYVVRLGISEGPGGCKNDRACTAYCEDTVHLGECLDFAERYNLRPTEEIAEGRKILTLLESGAKLPGGCKNKNECMTYCEDPSHMKECISFAETAGFISKEEAEEAKKIIPLLEQGEKTPGNCARKAACEAYCLETNHLDECLLFAEKAGLIPPEELADAKKFAPLIKSGETPGQCKRKIECEKYCSDTAHFEECIAFAQKVGIVSKEEAELGRKVKGKGPGGCTSRETCEVFCGQPENQETCINFAKEHGLMEGIPEIEAKIRGEVEGKIRSCGEKQQCSEFISCLQSLESDGDKSSTATGAKNLPADIQNKLNLCIEELKTRAIEETVGGQPPQSENYKTQPAEAGSEQNRQYDEQYKKQYEEEYKKQYDEEYKRQYEEQLKSQVNCSLFEKAPTCEYAGAPGSQNYNLCKQCFPNK